MRFPASSNRERMIPELMNGSFSRSHTHDAQWTEGKVNVTCALQFTSYSRRDCSMLASSKKENLAMLL
jgi:hypothetical protein